MIRFVLVLLALGIALGGAVWALHNAQHIPALPSFLYQTLILLVFSTAVIFGYLYNVDKPGFFVQLYLLTMAVKLLAYGAYNLVMILQDRAGAVANVVFFMAAYFVFTAVEIAFLYRKITHS